MGLFDGKNIVVTGAGKGIGYAIAENFAKEGAKVAVISQSEASCGKAAEKINSQYPDSAIAYPVNVGDYEAVQTLGEKILVDFDGVINILVNNAGIVRDGLIMRMKEEDWQSVIQVNLQGAFNFIKAFQRSLMKAEEARIINMTSIMGITGNAGQANYSASKAGLIGLTKSVAKELASRKVTCNAIAPGFIETDMTAELDEKVIQGVLDMIPLKYLGNVEDIASATLFLASPQAHYITGQVLTVDGGMTV